MFSELRQQRDLFDLLAASIMDGVTAIIAISANPATIESSRLGAQVLGNIGNWWHAQFPRRFPGFPNGADRGLVGMLLWNYLAGRSDWWCFAEQADPHGYGENSMRYWQLQAGNPLIPVDD